MYNTVCLMLLTHHNKTMKELTVEYIIAAFEKYSGYQFEYIVSEDIVLFSDYYFIVSDIKFVVDNKIDVEILTEWYDLMIENKDTKQTFKEYYRLKYAMKNGK